MYGLSGLVQMPNARFMPEGTVSLAYSNFDPYSRLALVASPFNWLEVLYHYTDIRDELYSPVFAFSGNQTYKDKGFDLKLRLLKETSYLPQIALGLRDAAGTGLFSSEYFVASKKNNFYDLTLGIGWGTLSANSISNPFSNLHDSYKIREATKVGAGGNFAIEQWFRGDAGIFGGVEFFHPKYKKIKLKIEYDGTNYKDEGFSEQPQDSNFNLGLVYNFNNAFKINAGFVRGNTFSFGFSLKGIFGAKQPLIPKSDKHVKVKNAELIKIVNKDSDRYINLTVLRELTKQRLNVRTVDIDNEKITVSFAQNKHLSYPRSYGRAFQILDEIIPEKITNFEVISTNSIFELAAVNVDRAIFRKYKDKKLSQALFKELEIYDPFQALSSHSYQPKSKYPTRFLSLGPSISSQIGGPDRFFVGGFSLRADLEILFRRNISLQSIIKANLYDSFDVIQQSSESLLPRVRTDIGEYYRAPEYLTITRLQLNSFHEIKNGLYGKLSLGYFEEMFGGYGAELLYRPFNSIWAIGAEAYNVRKRNYKQLLSFDNPNPHRTTTGHINLYLKEPNTNILFHMKGGRYLANDSGITFDFSRRFKSGMVLGAFFTRTDVSSVEFGEGSFDKGFYINFPLEAFFTTYRKGVTNFGLSPMTRDGGAALNVGHSLYGVTDEGWLIHLQRDSDDLYD